jgi:hypothetical protein
MRYHVVQNLTGCIQVRCRVYKSDKVLYTCPSQSRAFTYAQYLTGSKATYTVDTCCPRATDKRGREITLPISA